MFGWFSRRITTIKTTILGYNNRVFNIHNANDCIAFHPQVDWNIRPQNDSFSVQLEWRTRLTELIGRTAEMQTLQNWADLEDALSFKIIEAPGGTGKTRLAAEFAQALTQGAKWSAGFANLVDFERAQRLGWQGNWCIVVDYPEHSPDKLAQFIRAAKAGLNAQGKDKLRILLLCRHADSLPSKLQDAGAKSYLSATMPLAELATIDNFALITAALAKLGEHKPTPATITQAEFEAWQSQAALHKTALFVLALALHLDTNPAQHKRLLPAKDLLFALVSRETLRWSNAEQGAGAPAGSLANVIGMATLLGGLPAGEVNRAFAQAYGWPAQSAAKVLQALQEVWPLGNETLPSFAPISPDLLAAAFLWQWQSDITKRGLTEDAALISALACQCAAEMPALLQRWHMQAYDQTMRLMLGQASEAMSLAALLESAALSNPVFFQPLKSAFQQRSTWTALFQLASLTSKPTAIAGHVPSDAARAVELNNYSVALSAAGDHEGALLAALEAVEIYRRLAKANAAAYEPDLATSVSNLANHLSETGDRSGALHAALEAVEIRRRLAKANAVAYEPDLAASVHNLATCLSKTGDREGALRAALEAAEIRRRLAKANAVAYDPDLADSVSNLANGLSDTGDHEGALQAALEAVEIYRRLAKANAAAYEPDLAISVHNLASSLSNTGDRAGALRAALEAVEIRRRLAKANAAAYEPDLAASVHNLANCLSKTGDREGALRAALEAVEIYRRLAKANAAAYEPDLAGSVSNLANRLGETGDREGALRVVLEAVEIYRRLVKANAAAYEPDLAGSVSNLSRSLSATGDREGALRAALEAVEIFRRLAKANAAAYEPDLAMSLNNLANRLSATGVREGALRAALEAVEIRRRLTKANAAANEPDLAMSLCVMAIALAVTNDVAEAKLACAEVVDIFERLALQLPQVFAEQLAQSRQLLKNLQDS